jgi:uncharacterized membrane protein YgcG
MLRFIKRLFGIDDVSIEKKTEMDRKLEEAREKYRKILHSEVKQTPRKVTATSDYRSSSAYTSTPSRDNDNTILDTVVNTMIINEILSGNDQVSSNSSFINEDSHGFDSGFGGGDYSGGGSSGSWGDSSSSSSDYSSGDSSYDSSSSSSDW